MNVNIVKTFVLFLALNGTNIYEDFDPSFVMLKLRRLKDQISSDQNSLKQKQTQRSDFAAAFIKNDKKEKGSLFSVSSVTRQSQ